MKVVKIVGIVLLAVAMVALTAVVTAYIIKSQEKGPDVVYYTQILSRGTVLSVDEDGVLIKLEDESSFAGLKLHINNSDLTEQYTIGDYLDIYYDGTLVDGTVAYFHKIYKVEKYRSEGISLGDEWGKTEKTVDSAWFQSNVVPLLQKEFAKNDSTTLTDFDILAKNTKQNELYAVLFHVENKKDRNGGWKIAYVKDQGGVFSIIYHTTAFLTTDQIEFNNK